METGCGAEKNKKGNTEALGEDVYGISIYKRKVYWL